MMNRAVIFANFATVVVLLTSAGWRRNAGKIRTLTPSEAPLEAWNDIGRKLIAMAVDFAGDFGVPNLAPRRTRTKMPS
jgi:hypothetical protein